MINPRRIGTVITTYLPDLSKITDPLGYETILVKEHYYTHLRFPNSCRPTKLEALFPKGFQIEPKPGDKVSTNLYYKLEGEFIEGENYWKGGVFH